MFGQVLFCFFVALFLGFIHVSVYLFSLVNLTFLFLCAARLNFLCFLSLRQEFGKRILRGTAFLLETVCFDCKEVVCSFIAEKALCGDALL